MPGIVGLITLLHPAEARRQLQEMVATLRHEPFYETGTWSDESLGLYVGWTAHKGSFSEGMPICNEREDVVLAFSGEDYSDPDSLRRLKERGHTLSNQPSSYVVHVYEEDPSFPASLNGMFHGLLADRTRGTATVFNDRYGMHRLYFHQSQHAFYFAAEAKAILAVCPETRSADPRGLGELVACGCVLEDRTIFKGISALPAGSSWVFRNATIVHKGSYFQPTAWEEQPALEYEPYCRELRDVLTRILPRYFDGNQKVGMTLTGGLDTRVIMALRKSSPGTLPCYTFGGSRRETEDVRVARRVAKLSQQSHEVITIGESFLSRFSHYAEHAVYLTEGGADVYRASDLYFSENARAIAPVKVVGTYGSEILRHAIMLSTSTVNSGLFSAEFLKDINRAVDTYAPLRQQHPVTFAVFKQSPWHHHGILALEQTQLTVRSPYLDNDFVRTVFRAPAQSTEDVRLRLIHEGDAAFGKIRTDRGVNGNAGGLRAVVTRGMLEFTFRAEYAYDYGMPQWLAQADHLLEGLHLERLFLGRHKASYFRLWYRNELSKYVQEVLLDSRTLSRPYLNRTGIEAVVHGHLKGNRNYTSEIHKLLTLELLHRQFFDPQ